MQLHKVALADTHSFSSFFLDYISQKKSLAPFYHRFPVIENFEAQLIEKQNSFDSTKRTTLATTLTSQYARLEITPVVKQNIESLKNKNTFTVTTGHQLNVFTGPLYFIYKIVTVINACKELKKKFPAYHFVPVYWMATEDHDYDEIKSFRLYGKKYSWETKQTGAVGRFNPDGLHQLAEQLPGDTSVFKKAYKNSKTLADAVRCYVNDLFGEQGLVVIDADDAQLKSEFKEVIRQDVLKNIPKQKVEATNKELESLGYHTQIYARDINFFYLDNSIRSRIEKKDDHFVVLDSDLKFTSSEIEKLIETHPEKFSPNVILRPLYQEIILPNIAYAGGPAEVIYWLQLKAVFDHFKVPFPMLMPRNFAAVMDTPSVRKFEKTGLDLKDLFEEKNYLFNHWIAKNSDHNLSLGEDLSKLKSIFENIEARATSVDQTLVKNVTAQAKRAYQSVENIEKKILRAEKRRHQEKLGQLESVKDFLFPNASPQERVDNFLNFYQQDPSFIKTLLEHFDPFDFRFNILLP